MEAIEPASRAMRLLLDTHIVLWAMTGDGRLSNIARELINNPDNQTTVSVVTLWEIAIKYALRRRDMPISADEAFEILSEAEVELLTVESEHALAVARLPALHNDPFDRLLIAQATAAAARLVTRDRQVAAYDDQIILVR